MVGLRLFLPERQASDHERMVRLRVAEDRRTALTKPENEIGELNRVHRRWRRLPLRPCRLRLRLQRALPSGSDYAWSAVSDGGSRREMVYPAEVGLAFPVAKAAKRRMGSAPGGEV